MERKSSFQLVIVLLTLCLTTQVFSQNLFLKDSINNYYILDTIKLENPVKVLFEDSGVSLWLIMPESRVSIFDLEDESVYLLANTLLVPTLNKCESEEAIFYGDRIIQRFQCDVDLLIIVLLKKEYYIKTMSYLGSTIRKSMKKVAKNRDYVIAALPFCICK